MDVLPKQLQESIYFYLFKDKYIFILEDLSCHVSSIQNFSYICLQRCSFDDKKCGMWIRMMHCRPCSRKQIELWKEQIIILQK